MLIGVCGKANVGKSTFFKAATLIDVEIGARPFVTLRPNVGIASIRIKFPYEFANPQNYSIVDGDAFIPFKLMDVPGLIRGAHLGKGLGNEFLDELSKCDVIIHVVDASGETDENGNIVKPGFHDPLDDVKMLEEEFDAWLANVIKRHERKLRSFDDLKRILSGMKMPDHAIKKALEEIPIERIKGNELRLAALLRKYGKPMIIAANKIDLPYAKENFERLKKESGYPVFPCCAEGELVLRLASRKGMIRYLPGDSDFEIIECDEKRRKALELIREKVLKVWNGTGVQEILNKAVLEIAGQIVVFPVEDEVRWCDKKGNRLPHAFLMPKGSTPLDLAKRIHTDLAKGFIGAIDCISKQRLGRDEELKHMQIVKILFK